MRLREHYNPSYNRLFDYLAQIPIPRAMVPLFTGHLSASHGLLPAFKGLCSMPALASGILVVITDQGEAELVVSDQGLIIGAIIRGKGDQGLFALKKILDWKTGEYAFFEGDEYPSEHIKKTLRMDIFSIVRGIEGGGAGGAVASPQGQQQTNSAYVAPGQNISGQYQSAAAPVGMPLATPTSQSPGYQQAAYAGQAGQVQQAYQGGAYAGQGQETQAYNGAPMQAQPQAYGQQAGYGQAAPAPLTPSQTASSAPPDTVPGAGGSTATKSGDKKKPRKFASTNFAMDVFTEDKPLAPKLKEDEKVDDLMHNLTNLNRLGPSSTAPAARPGVGMSQSQVMRSPQAPSGVMPPGGAMPPPGMPPQGMTPPAMPPVGMQSAASAPAAPDMNELRRQAMAEEAAFRQTLAAENAAVQINNPAAALQNLMSQSTSGGYPDTYQQQQYNANTSLTPTPPAEPAAPTPAPAPATGAIVPTAQKKGRTEVTATLIEAPVFTDDNLFDEPAQNSALLCAPEPSSYGSNYGAQSGTEYSANSLANSSGSDYNALSQSGNYQGVQSGTDYNVLPQSAQSSSEYSPNNHGAQSGTDYNAIGQDQSYAGTAPSAMSSRHAAGGTSALDNAADSSAQSNQSFSQAPSFGPGSSGAAVASGTGTKSPGSAILEAMKRRQLGIPEDQPLPGSSSLESAQSLQSGHAISPLQQSTAPTSLPPEASLPPVAKGVPSFLQGRAEQVPSQLTRPEPVPSVLSRPEPVPSVLSRPTQPPPQPALADSEPIGRGSLDAIGVQRDMSASATYGARRAEPRSEDYGDSGQKGDTDSRSAAGSGRGRISKPGVSSRGMQNEQSFFEKNKILIMVGFVVLILLLVGGIIGALFMFHIISFNPPH